MEHITVLKDEAVAALKIQPDSVIVDATLGSGGHARAAIASLSEKGVFIGIDADESAIEKQVPLQQSIPHVHLVCENFSKLPAVLGRLHISEVDGILADLGWRMEQFHESGKGFSFSEDTPLIMTYGNPKDYPFTAHDIVNQWKETDIANVLYGYGEERYSRRIAKRIVTVREEEPIVSSLQLAEIIAAAVPAAYRHGKTHPATKSFQALRIAVNDELTVLETFITSAYDSLKPGGRLVIISFHSIEDRIVKHLFRTIQRDDHAQVITKKPITANRDELQVNPRARSAKLRILEKLP